MLQHILINLYLVFKCCIASLSQGTNLKLLKSNKYHRVSSSWGTGGLPTTNQKFCWSPPLPPPSPTHTQTHRHTNWHVPHYFVQKHMLAIFMPFLVILVKMQLSPFDMSDCSCTCQHTGLWLYTCKKIHAPLLFVTLSVSTMFDFK